jgi:probable phosphoglycerate mutase
LWHAENRYCGSTDVGLTDEGQEQAKHLAEWAGHANLDAAWASDLSRARITAEPSATAAGVQLRLDPRLRELDFGQAEGLTIAEMAERFPDALAAFPQRPGHPPLAAGRGSTCGGTAVPRRPGRHRFRVP